MVPNRTMDCHSHYLKLPLNSKSQHKTLEIWGGDIDFKVLHFTHVSNIVKLLQNRSSSAVDGEVKQLASTLRHSQTHNGPHQPQGTGWCTKKAHPEKDLLPQEPSQCFTAEWTGSKWRSYASCNLFLVDAHCKQKPKCIFWSSYSQSLHNHFFFSDLSFPPDSANLDHTWRKLFASEDPFPGCHLWCGGNIIIYHSGSLGAFLKEMFSWVYPLSVEIFTRHHGQWQWIP